MTTTDQNTTDLNTTSDRLLTEVERQQKYLDRLPDNYAFPLFNAAQALESQRRSGYRNTASAAREIVDNALEAGATRVDVCFERPKTLKAYQRADSISAIAADLCLLGACGLWPGFGLSAEDSAEAGVKRAMARASGRVAVIASGSKLARRGRHHVLRLEEIDVLVTDAEGAATAPFRAAGAEVKNV